jgi:hypothetical protein
MLILGKIINQRIKIPLLFDDGRLCEVVNSDKYAGI